MTGENPKVVLGLGNLLFGDEGFGIHAIHLLQDRLGANYGVDWVDGGVLGLSLLPLIERCSHLLVLDAVDMRQPPGTLVELEGEAIPLFSGVKLSEHQVGLQEVFALAKLRGCLPAHLHLLGVQPADIKPRVGLSQAVEAPLPAVVKRARVILESWFVN